MGGGVAGIPRGCVVTLLSVGSEGHAELGRLVCNARAGSLGLLKSRFARGVAEGEIAASTEIQAPARSVQTVQKGMSILARDGAGQDELEEVAEIAVLAWDARRSA